MTASACSVRPVWPQVTRVTIAINSDDAKPIVSVCIGASPRPFAPKRSASDDTA